MGGTTSQSHGGAADMMAGLTPVTLIVILAFAALVVIGMLYGARLRAKRREAEQEEQLRVENAPPAPPSPAQNEGSRLAPAQSPTPRVTETSPLPTAPAPPPLADEPVAAAAAYDASPATQAQPEPASSSGSDADAGVTILKGLGPKVAAKLNELGITRIGQIAALSPADADALDSQLGAFKGRMARDRWIDQAKLLAAGDRAEFEKEFGKL